MRRLAKILAMGLLIIICLLFFFFSIAFPGGRVIKRYNSDHEIIGYSVVEKGKETRYNKSWGVDGYTIYHEDRADYFTSDWNRDGYDLYEGDPVGEGEN